MSQDNNPNEIKDDEIRIISQTSASSDSGGQQPTRFNRKVIILILIGIALIVLLTAGRFFMNKSDVQHYEHVEMNMDTGSDSQLPVLGDIEPGPRPFTVATDTTVNRVPLTILSPCDATPVLAVGSQAVNDSSAVLVVQAADVRADNGEIVGAFVMDGEIVGRGERKGGFCAIIDGKITIGVAETTPLLEEAINTHGYFFRQYPLVVAGQVVENKPKGRALRKALAELNGRIVVVLSRERLTFHEFSQSLVDLGVTTAIYLVGSSAFYAYRTEDGQYIASGYRNQDVYAMLNFLIWR